MTASVYEEDFARLLNPLTLNSDTQEQLHQLAKLLEGTATAGTQPADFVHRKQVLARTLFDSLVFDLDAQRIVDFKLKPWAEQFLCLRAEIHRERLKSADQSMEITEPPTENKKDSPADQEQENPVPHRGVQRGSLHLKLDEAIKVILELVYQHQPNPEGPKSRKTPRKSHRNAAIQARHAAGDAVSAIARDFRISEQRVWQIIKDFEAMRLHF